MARSSLSRSARRPRSAVPRVVAPLLVTILFLIAACSGSATAPPLATVALPSAAPTATATAAPSFPVSLTDDEGTTVDLAAMPKKIVSLTPATTEILFAIGAGPRVVATTDFDDYPPEALALPHVASYTAVDVEKIVGLGADLVIAGGNGFNPPDAITQLRALKIPVLVVYAATTTGVLDDIRLIGKASGNPGAADAIAGSMAADFAAIKAATTGLTHPKVFYELDATSKIYTTADGSFLQEMIQLAGGDPVTTGSTTAFDIPLEKLVAANPDVILLGDAAYGVTPDQVKARPGWDTIKAVETGTILPVDDIVISRPGPRLVEGLRALAEAIHPGLALPPMVTPLPSAQG